MKELLDTAYIIIIAAIVYFGYKKSNKFYREFHNVPDEMKQEYLKQKGPLGFWEGGAVTRLPVGIAIIGNFLVVSIIFIMLVFFIGCLVFA